MCQCVSLNVYIVYVCKTVRADHKLTDKPGIFMKISKVGNMRFLTNNCNFFMHIAYDLVCVVLKKLIKSILRCYLKWCLCTGVCSYSTSPACSLSSGCILSWTWEYWTLALTQAARGAAAALARFAF